MQLMTDAKDAHKERITNEKISIGVDNGYNIASESIVKNAICNCAANVEKIAVSIIKRIMISKITYMYRQSLSITKLSILVKGGDMTKTESSSDSSPAKEVAAAKEDIVSDESVDELGASLSDELSIKHPLQHSWTLWYYSNDRTKTWEQNLREVTS
jgi:hypothetical protein